MKEFVVAGGRFLGGIFETKAKGGADAPARAAGTALQTAGMPLPAATGQWDMQQAVARGLERVGMVFRCVDAIAQTQSRIPMEIVKAGPRVDRSKAEVVDSPDLWKLLNFRSNSYETSAQLRYRISATALLSRRGAFVEMVPGSGNSIESLHLLLPGSVQPVPDPKKFVKEYQITRGDSVVDVLPPERVCWIKVKPHPMDPYSQLTPLMAAGISVDTDYLARVFNRNFLANDGRPGMLITIQGQLNREDADEIKSRFQGGVAAAGRTSVIEAEGLDVADLAVNPRDLQWNELLTMAKEDIQLAFGVPESVMGNASGRTFDNADAERENFYIDTIQPHCDALAMGLDPITGDSTDDTVVAYDYSTVDVLQRIAARKREEYRAEVAAGLKTIDEYREASGNEAFDVPGTRVLFTGSGLALAKDEKDQEAVGKMMPVGTPADPNAQSAAESGAYKGVQKGLAEGDRQRGNTQSATAIRQRAMRLVKDFGDDLETKDVPDLESKNRTERQKERDERKRGRKRTAAHPLSTTTSTSGPALKVHPYMGLRYKMEGFVEGQLTLWDTRQENVVAERLTHVKFRKGTRHWETKEGDVKPEEGVEYKALDPAYAINTKQWSDDLVSGLGDFINKAMTREAKRAAGEVRDSGIGELINKSFAGDPLIELFGSKGAFDRAMDPIYQEVISIIRTAADNQSARLQKAIAELDESGADLKTIERKVRQMTGTRAPWRKNLSVNVTTTAIEAVRNAVYKNIPGNLITKTWVSNHDARTRPTHVKADGQTKQGNQYFRVGSARMSFPCDPTAPIEEVANCRCYATYQLSEKAERALEANW